jgi:NADH-quinone oxidoreductase subunit M
MVGMLYERYHTREIADMGGLARRMPWMTSFFILFTLSSIGLPGLNGFAGEFLLLVGMFQHAWTWEAPPEVITNLKWIAVISVAGVVLGAWYMLWLVQRLFFGPVTEPGSDGEEADDDHSHRASDLCWREIAALTPLAVFVVWIGIQPQYFLSRIEPALEPALAPVAAAAERQREREAAGEMIVGLERTGAPRSHAPSVELNAGELAAMGNEERRTRVR